MVVAACTRKDQANLTHKTLQSLAPAITATIGKCVGIYSRKMSALRTMYSLILSDGGITDKCMNRMSKLYDTTTHQNLLTKLNVMATRYNVMLDKWKAELREYSVVIDNVDIFVRPRRESKGKTNIMNHMVQAIAVDERVAPALDANNAPEIPIQDIKASDVYPTSTEDCALKEMMVSKVLQMIAQIPALKEVAMTLPSETHKYTPQTSKKTTLVSYGRHASFR